MYLSALVKSLWLWNVVESLNGRRRGESSAASWLIPPEKSREGKVTLCPVVKEQQGTICSVTVTGRREYTNAFVGVN